MVFISTIITNLVFYPTDICKESKFIYLPIKSLSDQLQVISYSIFDFTGCFDDQKSTFDLIFCDDSCSYFLEE